MPDSSYSELNLQTSQATVEYYGLKDYERTIHLVSNIFSKDPCARVVNVLQSIYNNAYVQNKFTDN